MIEDDRHTAHNILQSHMAESHEPGILMGGLAPGPPWGPPRVAVMIMMMIIIIIIINSIIIVIFISSNNDIIIIIIIIIVGSGRSPDARRGRRGRLRIYLRMIQ